VLQQHQSCDLGSWFWHRSCWCRTTVRHRHRAGSRIVAGAVAVVRQRYPSWTQDQVVALLTRTGEPVSTDVAHGK
jgi:hypothetical protein